MIKQHYLIRVCVLFSIYYTCMNPTLRKQSNDNNFDNTRNKRIPKG